MPVNIVIKLKFLTMTNTLDYYKEELVMTVKVL